MSYEQFEEWKPSPNSQFLVDKANEIITRYQGMGYTLSLRQLYYQFVSKDLIPNTDRSYKNLGGVITKGRMAGLIPWDAIEDRNRDLSAWRINESFDDIFADLPYEFCVDMWAHQSRYIEVWVEKDALSSVVERACRTWRVPYLACKGYLSASEAYNAGKRMEERVFGHLNDRGRSQEPLVIHLGDHDPSGLDMTRDNADRLELFAGTPVEVKRIALNMNQIEQYSPPPNPAKITDSRARDYIAEHGRTSWELDALEPSVVERLIDDTISAEVDEYQWDEDKNREREERRVLERLRDNWDDVRTYIENEL